MKRTTLFIFLLMVLFTVRGEAMSFPFVAPTYITNIGTAAEWSEFCAAVNGGYDYSGVEVRLTDDITEVSDIVGTSSNCFRGTFDGQGHTITFSKTVTGNMQYTAPFGFIDGATIKNLKVTGTVTSGGRFAGGVVAYAKGISNVTNCINSTVITTTAYGTSNGGIVGMVGGAGTLTITGCVFNGEMHGTITEDWCGILGLSNTDCTATIIDCLFAPAAVDEGLRGHTIYRQGNGGHASQSNCHYTQTMNNLEGTRVYSVTGGENVIMAMDGSVTNEYDVSGLSYCDTGFTFDDIIYATNGESVSLNLDYYNLPEGALVAYSADHGTLSGDSNPYTLEMAAANTTISATVLPLRSSNGDVTQEIKVDGKVDTVFNCAAVVKHFAKGTEIEDVNVGGAAHCVQFCLLNNARLIHVSTYSTAGMSINGMPPENTVYTEQKLYFGQSLNNQYVHSKFLSERVVLDAMALHKLNAKVMRVGNLAPRSTDGEFQINFQTNSAMGRIRVYDMLGCYPYELTSAPMEFSPINEVAKAIVLLSETPQACCLFHPFNDHYVHFGDVLAELAKIGDAPRQVEAEAFSEALEAAKQDPEKAKRLSSLIAYQDMAHGQKAVMIPADNQYTSQVLYRLGFRWSSTSWDYVDQMLEAIAGFGYFEL